MLYGLRPKKSNRYTFYIPDSSEDKITQFRIRLVPDEVVYAPVGNFPNSRNLSPLGQDTTRITQGMQIYSASSKSKFSE